MRTPSSTTRSEGMRKNSVALTALRAIARNSQCRHSGIFGTNNVTPEASYIDASVRWNVTDNFTLTANVDNLLDDYPPQTLSGLFSQANTDPQVYRVTGRTLAVSGRYRF